MSNPKGPVTLAQRHAFDDIIDVRSPAEFADDHIPGAINCPVLDDEERRIVGTLYVQTSAFEARKLGGAMVARNIARHLDERFRDKPQSWRPLIYCWRGGMRSGSFVTWMRLVGWDAQQLAGGYKPWRQYVLSQLAECPPRLDLRVICGATGSAKTRVLEAMAAQGAQIIDLEGLAVHKGSLLGSIPGQAQPSQKWFETQLVTQMETLDPTRPVFIEAESRKIGHVQVPEALMQRMREAPCIEIVASEQARLDYLLRDYAYLGDDPVALADKLGALKGLQENATLARWQAWAAAGNLAPLFDELMRLHYDPLYRRSQRRIYRGYDTAQRVTSDTLSPLGIATLAHAILA